MFQPADALLQAAIDALPDPLFVKDLQHRIVACNQALCTLLGRPGQEIIGCSDEELGIPADQVAFFKGIDAQVMSTGQPHTTEESLTDAAGEVHTLWTRKFPLRDAQGTIVGLCGSITDISELHKRQQHIEQLEAQIDEKLLIIDTQAMLLDELAVPVIEVWDGVVLLPLIGSVDSHRAQRTMELMLEAITASHAHHIIVDISGVPVVDTGVAAALLRAVQASRLLGCQSILVGISPEIAQTLVGLGVDFGALTTRASLKQALLQIMRA